MEKELISGLENEMLGLIKDLKTMDRLSDEYKVAIDRITEISEILNDQRKTVSDVKNRSAEKWLSGVKIGVDVIGITAPLLFYRSWLKKGFQFEKTGIITSQTFKGLIGKFKPTR